MRMKRKELKAAKAFHKFAIKVLKRNRKKLGPQTFSLLEERLGDLKAAFLILSAGLKNERMKKAVSLIVGELSKLKEREVGVGELERAKEFCVMQLLLSLEKTMNSMLWLGESVLCLGRVRSTDEVINNIKAVTPQDLSRVAGKVFRPERLALAAIGSDIDGDGLEKTLRAF